MRKKSPWKAILITVLVLAVLGSGGFFGFRYFRSRNTEPVYVYDFNMVGMTEYWGDSKQMSPFNDASCSCVKSE